MCLLDTVFRTALSLSGGRPGSVEAGSSTLLGRRVNIDHGRAATHKNVDNNQLAILVWIKIPVNSASRAVKDVSNVQVAYVPSLQKRLELYSSYDSDAV